MNGIDRVAKTKERQKVIISSLLFLVVVVLFWQLNTKPSVGGRTEGLPGPFLVAERAWEMIANPFYDRGPNDKGIGVQLVYSLGRMAVGYSVASVVAIFLGVILGLYPTLYRALNPYIQILKPISPLPGCRSFSTPSGTPPGQP